MRASQTARGDDPGLVDQVLDADARRRAALTDYEKLRAEQKALGKQVAAAQGEEKHALLSHGKHLADRVKALQGDADAAEATATDLARSIGNVIEDGVPAGGENDYVVLRHEEMHHRFAHWRYTAVAVAIDGAFRPSRIAARSTRALRAALEAWADDAAAGASRKRRALVRRSLDAVGCGAVGATDSWGGKLARDRVRRLDVFAGGGALAGRVRYVLPTVTLAASVLVLTAMWTVGAHHAVALAGNC